MSDGDLVEHAREFEELHPGAPWPPKWQAAALREVARLLAERDAIWAERVVEGVAARRALAEVERLTREVTSLASEVGGLEFELLTARTEAAGLTVERDEARGQAVRWRGQAEGWRAEGYGVKGAALARHPFSWERARCRHPKCVDGVIETWHGADEPSRTPCPRCTPDPGGEQ